jgi:probable HAF family extracellular repeat protein
MRAGQTVNRWARVWGLTFFSLGIFHTFPAQAQQAAPTAKADPKHHHYKLVQIGTFGGSQSFNEWAGIGSRMMNSRGIATGQADTPASDPNCIGVPDSCAISYAFLWQNGALINLGGLPGDTEGSYADSINDRGWISGFSGNGLIDEQTGFPELVAVLWKDGKIKDLGTLGGNASAAYAINSRGLIVGAALNTIPDAFSTGFPSPLCGGFQCISETYAALVFPSATQQHAVLWQSGTIKDLGTLGGPDSIASQVNERGQIAGESYIDSTPNPTTGVPTIDAFFIGENGKMVDLGNLGGTVSWVNSLNNRGQVIGAMTVPGDTGFHPFLWDHGVLTDLGTFGFDCGIANAINDAGEIVGQGCSSSTIFSPSLWRDGLMINLGTVEGDLCGEAYGINSQAQVVGESGNCGNPGPNHAWLWEEDGPAIDLNKLIPPNSGIRLGHAISINDLGEIAGTGALPNGDHRAFVLIPCDEDHPDVKGCDYSPVDANAAAVVVPGVTKHHMNFMQD